MKVAGTANLSGPGFLEMKNNASLLVTGTFNIAADASIVDGGGLASAIFNSGRFD